METGIFIAAILALLILTLLTIYGLERRSKKHKDGGE